MPQAHRLFMYLSMGLAPALLPRQSIASLAHWVHGSENQETVVLIHGFNSSHTTWKNLVPELAKKYRVLVYDQPGHGESPAQGEDYSPTELAGHLHRLLGKLGIERVHLVGHSMGGRTAIQFAALYPAKTASVVIEDMSLVSIPQMKAQLPMLRERFARVREAVADSYASRDEATRALSAVFTPDEIPWILASATTGTDGSFRLGNRPEVTQLYLAQGLALDMTEQLRAVKAPLAFFAADPGDPTTVLKGAGIEHIRRARPNALVRVFTGSGHRIHGRPEFATALKAFLASHAAAL